MVESKTMQPLSYIYNVLQSSIIESCSCQTTAVSMFTFSTCGADHFKVSKLNVSILIALIITRIPEYELMKK